MPSRSILGLTLSIACLGVVAVAQPIPTDRLPREVETGADFSTAEEFLRWTANYYRNPRPREIDQAFRYFLNSGLMQDEARRIPIAAFFGAVFRERLELSLSVQAQVNARRDYDSLFAFANSLWLANTDGAREMLRSMADAEPNEQVKTFLIRRSQSASPIAEGREIRSLSQIETIWGEFGASGNPRIAERVTEVLLIEFEASPDALVLQQAAEQSLRLRARDHERVREGMRAAIDKAMPSPRRDRVRALLDELTPAP